MTQRVHEFWGNQSKDEDSCLHSARQLPLLLEIVPFVLIQTCIFRIKEHLWKYMDCGHVKECTAGKH